MKTLSVATLAAWFAFAFAACSHEASPPGDPTGGASGTGNTGTGGNPSGGQAGTTGGSGASATGGSTSGTGGTTSGGTDSGGSAGLGTGGSAGTDVGTGGVTTGGTPATGGTPSTGGSSTGGAAGMGGMTTVPEPVLVTSVNNAFWRTGTLMEVTANADITVNDTQVLQDWTGFGGTFNEKGWEALAALSQADRDRAIRLLFDGSTYASSSPPA